MGPIDNGEVIFLDIELYRPRTKRGRAGFFNDKTKLAAIALAVLRKGRIQDFIVKSGPDEVYLLKMVSRILSKNVIEKPRRGLLVGYNFLTMDIPFLLLRANRLMQKRDADNLRDLLLRRYLHLDLFQLALYFYDGEGLPSFDSFYRAILLARGHKQIEGKKSGYIIHELYEKQKFDEIEKYSRVEIQKLVTLYNIITQPGPVYSNRVPKEWRRLTTILLK